MAKFRFLDDVEINGEGKVGVGTSTTLNKVDINGNTAIGFNYAGKENAPANGLIVEGDLGLGTSVPQNKLDVNGAMVIGAAHAGINAAPENSLLVQSQVYIGTATPDPAYALHVEGEAKIQGDLTYEGDIIQDSVITYTSTDTSDGLIVIDQGNETAELYKLKNDYHALSNGPIKIGDGITVEIPDNTQWKII